MVERGRRKDKPAYKIAGITEWMTAREMCRYLEGVIHSRIFYMEGNTK